MGNKPKDKTKKTGKTSASKKFDLTGYKFTYRSEPTFVVPLIDFLTGLAPLQSPITKKEKVEQPETENRGRLRFMREFLSHELVEAFSLNNSSQLSKKILELGNILGFNDKISLRVLGDAGIKLNRFYQGVYIIYALVCVSILIAFGLWFFIVPSVTYIQPSVTPIASPSEPTSLPTSTSPTASSSEPTSIPPTASLSEPTSVPPTVSPSPIQKVPPSKNLNRDLVKISIIYAPFFILFGLVFIFMVIRLGILITGKRYASTLCLLACLYIVFELEQDDVLSIDRIKIRLLNRIDFLAKYIPLVGMNISHSDPSVKEWTLQYFRTMQKYVRQLERQVIAPKKDTLESLRKYFYTMAGILLYGNYAEIDWETLTSNDQDKPKTSGQRIGSMIQGFIGIGIPILLLLVVIFYPGIIPTSIGIDKVSIIAIAWFLIAVDVNLRLGVIDRILDIAKAIKELT
jgi:hypothetical protein